MTATYIKVINTLQLGGMLDYKGLDITSFITGTQTYSRDHNTFCGMTYENLETTTEMVEETVFVDVQTGVNEDNEPVYEKQERVIMSEVISPKVLHDEVFIITEDEYKAFKEENKPKQPVDLESEIEKLKEAQSETDDLLMSFILGGGF